jgi:hypothetical protein
MPTITPYIRYWAPGEKGGALGRTNAAHVVFMVKGGDGD